MSLALIYRHEIIYRVCPVPNYCILFTQTVVLCSLTDTGQIVSELACVFTNRSEQIRVTQLLQRGASSPIASWRVYVCQLLLSITSFGAWLKIHFLQDSFF